MSEMEHAIRECAYHLWQAAGSPDGSEDAFWLSAQRQVLAKSLGAIAHVTVEPDASSAIVVAKTRKETTAPRKTKRQAA